MSGQAGFIRFLNPPGFRGDTTEPGADSFTGNARPAMVVRQRLAAPYLRNGSA
jgi:hypothetical protein